MRAWIVGSARGPPWGSTHATVHVSASSRIRWTMVRSWSPRSGCRCTRVRSLVGSGIRACYRRGGGSALVGLAPQEALDLGGELVSGGKLLLGALFETLEDLLHVLVGRDRGVETQTLGLLFLLELLHRQLD